MEESLAKDLIKKYREGTLTGQEKAMLESWYLDLAKSREAVMEAGELEKHLDEVWESLPVHHKVAGRPGILKPLITWISVAASVLILCSVGVYMLRHKTVALKIESEAFGGDALPGDNRAKLTLADGKSIMLDEINNGKVAQEGQTAVIKTRHGEIVYQAGASLGKAQAVTYNTIRTPKAGQYQVKLPDGTRVWLNAASSIRFPTVFQSYERIVEIVGEVYFEVAKVTEHARRVPFKVKAGNQVIEVLGTHFNVNSYADENSIKTTLLEGSIRLEFAGQNDQGVLLKPGQQARFLRNSGKNAGKVPKPFVVQQVDTHSVIAWKEGYFRFDNVGLPELMRQLSRWYDMEVIYEGPVKEYEFVGQIERGTNLSKVLQILELGDVHFRIEEKKIIVTE